MSAHYEPARPGKAASVLRAGASWVAGVPCRALIALVRLYRLVLSPWLGSACRFEPTCSRYAIEALERHGALAGGALAGWRLLRCHPWCAGGCDAVPGQAPRLFAHLGLGARAAAEPSPPNTNPSSPLSGPTSP